VARRRGRLAGRHREVPAAVHGHGSGSGGGGEVRNGRGPSRARKMVGGHESARASGMKLKIGQATISIERGDITDFEADALVNAANSTLVMGAGVAGAVKRKGGAIIEEEALQQGPIEVGEAVLTTGGNLIATHVIHAAVMGPDLKTNADIITTATKAVLVLADKH